MDTDTAGRPAGTTVAELRNLPASLDVPQAGWIAFRIGRTASYAAAHRGDLPVIKVGRRLVVPTPVLLARLGIEP